MRLVTVSALLWLSIGCSRDRADPRTDEPHRAAERFGTAAWADPEPVGAQKLAEEFLGAPWNTDKATALEMRITTLVARTTGLTGFGSSLVPVDSTLDSRLERLGAEVTDHDVTIRLPGSILFDFNKASIRPDAERTLAEVLEVLKAYANRPIRIEGHTDVIASEAYNQDLSERRAASVRDWLMRNGLAATALQIVGRGESQPVADNSTPEGRQMNRRVEIIIQTKT